MSWFPLGYHGASLMNDLVGHTVGPYRILALIGRGGMGVVYRAEDPRLGRQVAIKMLVAEVAGDRERLQRFEREARAASALNHPNILIVHEINTHDGQPYLVTELLEGRSLREVIDERTMTVHKTLQHGRQIAAGLAAAHAKGITHRDLKPDNLFVSPDGHVKVLDACQVHNSNRRHPEAVVFACRKDTTESGDQGATGVVRTLVGRVG